MGLSEKRPEGGTRLWQPEHTRMVKPCRMWTLTQMMMVCEVGRRNGLDAGPLDPLAFWFLKDPDKKTRGYPCEVIQAYHHGETTWHGAPHTYDDGV